MQQHAGDRAEAVAMATRYLLVTPVAVAVADRNQAAIEAAQLKPRTGNQCEAARKPNEWACDNPPARAHGALKWRHFPSIPPRSGGG